MFCNLGFQFLNVAYQKIPVANQDDTTWCATRAMLSVVLLPRLVWLNFSRPEGQKLPQPSSAPSAHPNIDMLQNCHSHGASFQLGQLGFSDKCSLPALHVDILQLASENPVVDSSIPELALVTL